MQTRPIIIIQNKQRSKKIDESEGPSPRHRFRFARPLLRIRMMIEKNGKTSRSYRIVGRGALVKSRFIARCQMSARGWLAVVKKLRFVRHRFLDENVSLLRMNSCPSWQRDDYLIQALISCFFRGHGACVVCLGVIPCTWSGGSRIAWPKD